MSNFIITFILASERIYVLGIKGKLHNVTLILVYAPTENANEEEVNCFYEELQTACAKFQKHDAVIILRDFNAKLGKEKAFVDIFGKHTLHTETNDNGLRVGQFASPNNYFVASTSFRRTTFPYKKMVNKH